MRKTKILITGGAGFIGSNLIKKLDKNRWDIIVIDSLIEQVHASRAWDIPEGVTFYHKDIRDKKALSAALNQVGYIVHLSAETGVGQSAYAMSRYVDTNEHGTAILLETALKVSIQFERYYPCLIKGGLRGRTLFLLKLW